MKSELDRALVRDFPLLFRNRNRSIMETCMAWGFECGDGWEPLIRQTAKKLELLIKQYIAEAPENVYPPCASQIKEKYGELRFYLSSGTDDMYEITERAEIRSARICETCGKKGRIRGQGWYYTACNEHAKEGDKDGEGKTRKR